VQKILRFWVVSFESNKNDPLEIVTFVVTNMVGMKQQEGE
jgi:hypothetical protein